MNPDTIYKVENYVMMTKDGQMHVEEWTGGTEKHYCINITLMTPKGPIPVLHKTEAKSVQEAFDTFADEAQKATDNIKKEMSKPRIAVPSGPMPPMPPGGPKIQLR